MNKAFDFCLPSELREIEDSPLKQETRVLCSPESFVSVSIHNPSWGSKEICEYFNQPKLWYYRMLGLKKVQVLLREEQQKLESVINPEVGSSVTERFTSLLYSCVDQLEEAVLDNVLDPRMLIELSALSTKVIALGDNVEKVQGTVSAAIKEEETPSDKMLKVLQARGEADLGVMGVKGWEADELKTGVHTGTTYKKAAEEEGGIEWQ